MNRKGYEKPAGSRSRRCKTARLDGLVLFTCSAAKEGFIAPKLRELVAQASSLRRWLSGLVVGRASYGGVSQAAGAASATGKALTWSVVHWTARAEMWL